MRYHDTVLLRRVCAFIVIAIGSAGCVKSATDTAPPDYLELYGDLVQVDRGIQDALAADPPGDPHDLVHDAGRLLSHMAEVDSQSGLNATQCADVHNIAQDLLGAFAALDAAIETGEAPDYESMRDRIQSGMAKLREISDATP